MHFIKGINMPARTKSDPNNTFNINARDPNLLSENINSNANLGNLN